jgi:hypothetical protein
MPKDPSKVAKKWADRLKGATSDIREGIKGLSESPTKKAAEKIDLMKARWIEAADSGKIKRELEKVDLKTWQDLMDRKGIPNISTGADAATPKMEDFFKDLLAYEEKLKADIEKMPETTLQDRINRAVKWMNEMAKFKKK